MGENQLFVKCPLRMAFSFQLEMEWSWWLPEALLTFRASRGLYGALIVSS